VELSTRLLAAQLQNVDATIRSYMRMVDGQASDLYASNMDRWSATSSIQGSSKEPAVDSHSPSGSRTH
jgi:hypothetical protein